ncbi:MAG: DapH/DapD/GlmU-related protein [Bacteroidota bacterium]
MTQKNIKNIYIQEVIDSFSETIISTIGTKNNYFNSFSSIEKPLSHSLIWVNSQNSFQIEHIISLAQTCVIITEKKPQCSIPDSATILIVKKSKLFFIQLLNTYFVEAHKTGIHPTAVIDTEAEIGKNVYIGPHCIIGKCTIGNNCVLEGNNYVYDNVIMGKNIILQAGAIIGAKGMSLSRNEQNELIGFPSLGNIIIEDDVEIGSNSCIDCAVLTSTIIGKGTKINSLSFIGNSVIIGNNNYISVSVNINGSVHIGKNNFIGSGSTIRNKISIGNNNTIGAGAVVIKNIDNDSTWIGNPAKKTEKSKGIQL